MDDHKLYAKEEERWLDGSLFATNLLSKAAGGRWSRQILRRASARRLARELALCVYPAYRSLGISAELLRHWQF